MTWWLDELGHAGAEHLDPTYIAGYDRKSGFDPGADLELLRGLGLDSFSTLIDMGAGTGALAAAAAPLCRRVVAVDLSTAMLDALRARAETQGIQNLEVVRAGFLSYVHTGDPADFVYSRNALHHLPDFWKAIALRRVAAMMRIGGVLRLHDLVFSGEPQEVDSIMDAWLAGAAPRPEAGYTRTELETHVREEHSTYDWLLQPMLERAGFEVREATHRPSRTYSAYVCVRIA